MSEKLESGDEEPPPKNKYGRLPFNLFNPELSRTDLEELIANHRAPEVIKVIFNINDPENNFNDYWRQGLNTTHELLGEIEREEYLKLEDSERQRHVRIYNLIHHVISTPTTYIKMSKYPFDLESIQKYYKYFFHEVIRKYYGEPHDFIKQHWQEIQKEFTVYILLHIADSEELNNEGFHFGDWIDIYSRDDNKVLINAATFKKFKEDFETHIMLAHELLMISQDYKVSVLIQTLLWYMLNFTNPKDLDGFKYEKTVNIDKLIECFAKGIYSSQDNLKPKPIEP